MNGMRVRDTKSGRHGSDPEPLQYGSTPKPQRHGLGPKPGPHNSAPTPGHPKSERHSWDPLRLYPDTLVDNARGWFAARPARRRALWVLAALFALFVFPGLIGAIATAAEYTGHSSIDGLSWMNIRDSRGVSLASYQFVADTGSLLQPDKTIVWTILTLEFVGYLTIVTTAIWIVGYALGFQWMDWFGSALTGVADALTGQIATQMVLITAATIGAFFVAWFVVRGFHAKATMQVLTMVVVAVIGPIYLAEPLAEVLSSHGLLSEGRDLGLTVAAGLHGDSNPNSLLLVTTMQENMADNFARKPTQVWNFGHLLDTSPACEQAWSTHMRTASDLDNIRDSLETCGDTAAYNRASNPSMGQAGTGLLLLIGATILLAFGVYLAVRIIKAALDAIYHCFMTIFGFAAGGFVYGPTQTFLVRNLVDGCIAAARMTIFIVFLAVYLLFLGNLFEQAEGQVVQVIIIACVVEVVAISQLQTLNDSLSSGNDWIVNRFASTIQGNIASPPGGGGGGAGAAAAGAAGGTALGMGVMRSNSGGGRGLGRSLPTLAALNASPAMAWMAGAVPDPLDPLARKKKVNDLANFATADARREHYAWGTSTRKERTNKALDRANKAGGLHTQRGLANAVDGLGDWKTAGGEMLPIFTSLGVNSEHIDAAYRAASVMQNSRSDHPTGWGPIRNTLAMSRAVENHPAEGAEGVGFIDHNGMVQHLQVTAGNFARHTNKGRADLFPLSVKDQDFVERITGQRYDKRARNPLDTGNQGLWDSELGMRNLTADEWNSVSREARWTIAHAGAQEHLSRIDTYRQRLEAGTDDAATEAAYNHMRRSSSRIANIAHLNPNGGMNGPFAN